MSPNRILAASSAALSSLVLASVACGQGADVKNTPIDADVSKAELNAQKENLRDRNRGLMHPGDPLEIIGIEQGDNEIRSRTPALAGAEHAVVIVDDDEAYRRKLALYDSGSVMQPVTIPRETRIDPRPKVKPKVSDTPAEPAANKRVVAYLIGFVTSVLLCGWMFKRYSSLFIRRGA